MTVQATSVAPACVAGYAARLHAAIGARHHVGLAAGRVAAARAGRPGQRAAHDRAALTEVLGCDIDAAAAAAADLLADPHPLVASAAAVWTASAVQLPETASRAGGRACRRQVTIGELPDQAGLDAWAREHTFGLIDRFPIEWTPDLYLVLATALATKVSWQVPFDLAPAASLGVRRARGRAQVSQVLRTPEQAARAGGHVQFIAATPQAGDVIVHIAAAVGRHAGRLRRRDAGRAGRAACSRSRTGSAATHAAGVQIEPP